MASQTDPPTAEPTPTPPEPATTTTTPPAASASTTKTWWRRLLTVPGLIGVTALTTVVSWSATMVLTRMSAPSSRPEDAIAISVETDPGRISGVSTEDRFMVIPASVRTKGSPGTGCGGFHQWGVDNGGFDGGQSTIQIVAQGRSDQAVLITTMNVLILLKTDPVQGIPVRCPSAGEAQVRAITVDLDAAPPKVSYESNSGAPFGFTLAKGETETFVVTASTARSTYRWRLQLGVVVDGKRKTINVGPAEGFATTASPKSAFWDWNFKDAWMLTHADGTVDESRTSPATSALPPVQ
jgi:hypothetical protein